MSKLSIIIVNYNVKYFLDQCLGSVKNALHGIPSEIIVVDNASSDGSCEMVKAKYPEVILIQNKTNTGFSTANNQGIKISKGEYVLLLNPDTLLQEDTLEKCLQFMDEHPDAGALGVKMLDGKGNFLPESKRSLPTPAVSFFKIFGFTTLFPKSKMFGRYHLGYLDENETHAVEVLPGAFMLIRKKVLDKTGLLDESFFMYGEDIDLSYRITKAGYKNYYFPKTRIIHYKGESTKKGSLNYVRMFYNAMIIFAKKHFSPQQAGLYSLLITTAVYLRAGIAYVLRILQKIALPALDASLLLVGMYFIRNFWATNIKNAPEYYPLEYMRYVVPAYIFVWLVSVFLSGGYDKPLKTYRVVRGLVVGTILIAAFYAFLPESLRFSRAMILLGAAWAGGALVGLRLLAKIFFGKKLDLHDETSHRLIIAGSEDEVKRTLSLITQSGGDFQLIGYVSPNGQELHLEQYLGSLDELPDIRDIYQVDEVIYCSKDISAQQIIASMVANGPELNYKIVPEKSMSVIGSNSKNSAGDLYAIDINLSLSERMNRRNKRLFDLLVCFVILITFPIKMFLVKHKSGFLKNWWNVLLGKKSWVGYEKTGLQDNYSLPLLKEGILSPVDALKNPSVSETTRSRLNLLYAKDYKISTDLNIVWKGLRELGR